MSLLDRTLNAARAATENHQRVQRRRAVEEQIDAQREVIRAATARIGRLALDAARSGVSLPPETLAAAAAITRWEGEVAELRRQLPAS